MRKSGFANFSASDMSEQQAPSVGIWLSATACNGSGVEGGLTCWRGQTGGQRKRPDRGRGAESRNFARIPEPTPRLEPGTTSGLQNRLPVVQVVSHPGISGTLSA